ncbi:hypothetical protein [Aliamphritea spongicola]|nr:hypothetical protein [Aliamphritea spongicola]
MVQSGFDHHAINWVEPHPAEEAISTEQVPVAEPVGNMANTASIQAQADMEAAAIRVDVSTDKTPG